MDKLMALNSFVYEYANFPKPNNAPVVVSEQNEDGTSIVEVETIETPPEPEKKETANEKIAKPVKETVDVLPKLKAPGGIGWLLIIILFIGATITVLGNGRTKIQQMWDVISGSDGLSIGGSGSSSSTEEVVTETTTETITSGVGKSLDTMFSNLNPTISSAYNIGSWVIK